jgi:alpha-1,2-mannosyltransferase
LLTIFTLSHDVEQIQTPPLPFPRLFRWLAILSLTVIATGVMVNWRYPYLMDFLSYWAAAVMAVGGSPANAYDIALHNAVQQRAFLFDTKLPFAYPPPFLLLLVPLGLLSYAASAGVWIGATLAAYAAAVRRVMPDWAAAAIAFPPVAICGISGQNGMLIAALFMAGLSKLGTRPFVAGLIFGCLAIKPQLGVLLPLAFIAAREWRAFAGATVAVLMMIAVSLIAFGVAPWLGFFAQSTLYASIATDGLVGWHKMASVYTSLRLVGLANAAAWSVHITCAVAATIAVWQVWRSSSDTLTRGAILAPASLLISPYLYVYDQILLIVSLYWLARQGVSHKWLVPLYLLPLTTIAQFWTQNPTINLAPLTSLLALALVWWRVKPLSVRPDERLHQHDPQIAQSYR